MQVPASPARLQDAPYFGVARDALPRIISWINREPSSTAYGCGDRTYWCWKFSDFPGARYQESVYALAELALRLETQSDPAAAQVLEWVGAGVRFWHRIQYRDGSFDEAYPFERSLAATAFTSFYVGEALLLLGGRLDEATRAMAADTLALAGEWLCRHDESHGILSNHLAAAAAALLVAAKITSTVAYEQRAGYFLRRIYARQSDEGWYEEYGGADPGYQTYATFYLARAWQQTRDPELLASLERSVEFLQYFVHPNGTIGGEYGSRNTEFYFPAGLEMLAPVSPAAARIAAFMRLAIAQQREASMTAADPQNLAPLLNNYFFAARHASDLAKATDVLPWQRDGQNWFPKAGLLTRSTAGYYAVVGLSKGGVTKVYDRDRQMLVFSDCGYWGVVDRSVVVSSQHLQHHTDCSVEPDAATVTSAFVRVRERTQSVWSFVAFRLFSLTLGRVPAAAGWLKRVLVARLVRTGAPIPLRVVRTVRFENSAVVIVDRLEATGPLALKRLRRGSKFSSIHMGSSRYFQWHELDGVADGTDFAGDIVRRGMRQLEHRVSIPCAQEQHGS